MNCKYCNSKIADGAHFCQNCGAKVERASEPWLQSFEEKPALPPKKGPCIAWGILSIIFGFVMVLNVLGIIFAIVGLVKAKRHEAKGYTLAGESRACKILCMIGLPISIITTVVYSAVFILPAIAIFSVASEKTSAPIFEIASMVYTVFF